MAAGSEGSVPVNSPVADVSGSVSAMGEGVTYTPEEQEMIAVSIEEADRLASSGDYETALKQIDTAREAYPEASDLRAKQDELNGLYGQQMKANTLERGNTLAEEGDYLTAMHMIEECMQSYGEDNECLAAKEHYITMYKQDILQRSAAYSDAGDYVSAIQLLQSATKEMGNDPELETRSLEYESAYVSGVLAEADSRVSGQDFDGAEKVLKTAKEILPGNSRLDEAVKTVNKSRPRSLLAACPPYQTTVWSPEPIQ